MSETDLQLLSRYHCRGDHTAFDEIVRRHLNLVHSAALRQVHSPQLAEEVAQTVFTELAKQASTLAPDTLVTGWLYEVTRRKAIDVIRREARRQIREQTAMEMNAMNANTEDWRHIEPLLDDAMESLDATDRTAVLLRFFENRSLRDVGVALGTSDDAAQKRVSRAVEKLREYFQKQGLAIGAGVLATAVSTNAVQAAPAGLAIAISTATASTAAITSVATTTTKTIAMTTLQKTFVAVTVTALAGTSIYQTHQATRLRDQAQTLQKQHALLTEQARQLQNSFTDTTNRLANLLTENSTLRRNPNQTELLRLRGEVSRLRNDAEQANDPIVQRALRWKANVEKMKLLFAEHPEQQVPEMKLLSDQYFFDLARDQDLESAKGIRKAYAQIRNHAKNTFAYPLQQALTAFIADNAGDLPGKVSDLKPYFKESVDDAMLDQYRLLFTGKMSDVKGNFVLRDKAVIDPEFDYFWGIGPNAYGPDSQPHSEEQVRAQLEATMKLLTPAIEGYMRANGGTTPTALGELKPFITTPEQQSAFDTAIKAGVGLGTSR